MPVRSAVKSRSTVLSKGIFYFPSHSAAETHALQHGFPTDRILSYELGFAIQLGRGGEYVGPTTPKPTPTHASDPSLHTHFNTPNRVA